MSDHGIYTGTELFDLEPINNKALIKDILWERDNIILMGKPKSGKSILAQQMCFAMSCGEPFLGEYPTIEACCLYIQVEGKLRDEDGTRDRAVRMSEAVGLNKKNFNLIYMPGLLVNTIEGMARLKGMIDRKMSEGMPRPKVIVLDPLYMCMQGDIKEQEPSSRMCMNLRILSDIYDCAIILIHHEHRPKTTESGSVIKEGSRALFGSYVWQAFPDHILLFSITGRMQRELECDIQRSGRVKDKLELSFIEPTPLLFIVRGETSPYINLIEMQLSDKPITTQEICNNTKLAYNSVNKALVELRRQGKIKAISNNYPKEWLKV